MKIELDTELSKAVKDSAKETPQPFSKEWSALPVEDLLRIVQDFTRASADLLNENLHGQINSLQAHEVGNTVGKLLNATSANLGQIQAYERRKERTGFDITKEERFLGSLKRSEINTFWLLAFMESLDFYTMEAVLQRYKVKHASVISDTRKALIFLTQRLPINLNVIEPIKNEETQMNVGCAAFLIKNIIKNAKHNGQADKIEWATFPKKKHVLWELSDNGSGIAPQNLPHIFDEGFSGGGSTGIGLGKAPEKLAQFGATIRAEANGGLPNKDGGNGAKFIIELQKA